MENQQMTKWKFTETEDVHHHHSVAGGTVPYPAKWRRDLPKSGPYGGENDEDVMETVTWIMDLGGGNYNLSLSLHVPISVSIQLVNEH